MKHTDTVTGYWEAIESYFDNIKIYIPGVKLYQDGMFVDGDIALKFLSEGIKAGSKNSEIVSIHDKKIIRVISVITCYFCKNITIFNV